MAQRPPTRDTEPQSGSDSLPRAGELGGAGTAGEQLGEMAGGASETTLGEFRILRRLGKGGMAEVFLAEQVSLRRNVAIKVLREERLNDEVHLKRFKTEATAAATLNHPNIVQVYTVGEQGGIHYIAQEYVQGMNLREYVARKGPPELSVALHIMKQVAGALQAAHAAGIVHRDIKPENIMLTRRGDVKVADFGLAQLTQSGERVHLTQVGVTMGTPLYMSPEQVSGKTLDARTDIYSFGVTCYHMLTGTPPFRGETALSVAVQHLKQEPERLEKVRGDLPPVLCRIVHKLMAKNPDKRYQTAQEVLRDLKRLTQGESPDEPDPVAGEALESEAPAAPTDGGRLRRVAAGIWRLSDRSLASQAWLLTLLALLTGVASAGVGWLAREANPFDTPAKEDQTKDKGSAAKQYLHALNLKTSEPAWRKAIDYQPSHPLFRNYAREKLALLLLTKGRENEAEVLFDQLASETEGEFRAFGLAGQAFLLHHRQDYDGAQNVISKVKPMYGRLDPQMKDLFDETLQRNYKAIQRELDQEWRNLLESPRPESGSPRDTD